MENISIIKPKMGILDTTKSCITPYGMMCAMFNDEIISHSMTSDGFGLEEALD